MNNDFMPSFMFLFYAQEPTSYQYWLDMASYSPIPSPKQIKHKEAIEKFYSDLVYVEESKKFTKTHDQFFVNLPGTMILFYIPEYLLLPF